MTTIIDYGVGNIASIENMLRRLDIPVCVGTGPKDLERAKRIILPGVGSFDTGMRNLRQSGLLPALEERVLGDRVPVLGICLGMQLFANGSEEGAERGLGWIPGFCRRFPPEVADKRLRIPHMGWNSVTPLPRSRLFEPAAQNLHYYFVHSYFFECDSEGDVSAKTSYGIDFSSAIERDNIFGVQFHPEKSHRFGLSLFNSFVTQT
ncbi:MAG: imidazole glycerol phosphate synthase subunit HisH [Alphaproteobacteria bacterium]|nr:imidazole glycerol phosphate synthase subunit HisH [Alphaproteobacteria bacterium]